MAPLGKYVSFHQRHALTLGGSIPAVLQAPSGPLAASPTHLPFSETCSCCHHSKSEGVPGELVSVGLWGCTMRAVAQQDSGKNLHSLACSPGSRHIGLLASPQPPLLCPHLQAFAQAILQPLVPLPLPSSYCLPCLSQEVLAGPYAFPMHFTYTSSLSLSSLDLGFGSLHICCFLKAVREQGPYQSHICFLQRAQHSMQSVGGKQAQ